ncbi:Dihydrolipoamide acetyltransferase component of pyruvate dehydrogenase complex [Liberibacter crescens BT-1]|uniref:Acetyltransferase component of pyruvate dehydrogenase complex n=1 Tax=Liberibacter crescens (strain BT-1) TaxID=1215343 RepID=L0EW80_LIBCB|nr:pyruvate dehydrogenase complex dihydrolipoamide acetyltransferase [Liberibacter crescens]AGA65095.1 Dihydrolipoamide acetyltransferase component of pyruvate dehydrogenase complex [Liberibacter crescens BT-1]AMC13078.1 branched-chain alpha-keto acid dehydrogenase subunit E2 [Liberibacter crescens]
MTIKITMPALSPTMEEGKIAKWLVKEGDSVSSGDIICEIETDKAIMEVESVYEGIVEEITVPEGTENVKVNSVILLLSGEDDSDISEPSNISQTQHPSSSPEEILSNPLSRENSAELNQLEISINKEKVFSSPLARRIAKEKNIDIFSIKGSGPYGRVIKRDVENSLPTNHDILNIKAPSSSFGSGLMPDASILKLFEKGSYDLEPHDSMRKTIAARLQQATQTIPHFYVSIDCEIDQLLALRSQINTSISIHNDQSSIKISVNDMVIKALAMSMLKVPSANVSWTETALIKHHHVDVAVAVRIQGGLITPIIRKADQKKIIDISQEMKELGRRAKEKKLKPEEYQGGMTSISNMGMLNIKSFSSIINPPQSTILAVGTGEKRPVVKNNEIKIATVMTVTLSADHRAIDGALAAELLLAFKSYIENPAGILI